MKPKHNFMSWEGHCSYFPKTDESSHTKPRMYPVVTSVCEFCLQVTNWRSLFHRLLACSQIGPGLQITLDSEQVFYERQVILVPPRCTSFDTYPAFCVGIHPVFIPQSVILHQFPFKARFHLLKCFFSLSLSIHILFSPHTSKGKGSKNSKFPFSPSLFNLP